MDIRSLTAFDIPRFGSECLISPSHRPIERKMAITGQRESLSSLIYKI